MPWLLAFVLIGAGGAKAQTTDAIKAAIKTHTVSGFILKSVKADTAAVQENWVRANDGAQLTIKITPKQTPALANSKVKALNSGVKTQNELLFRCESHGAIMAWTNYRADHGSAFRTYRYLRLEGPLLVEQSLAFPKAIPSLDNARFAFVTMRKTATDLFKRLSLIK
ncbi:MAG: hypothetical protein QM758_23505 [Armatimonas sp.]